MPEIIQVRAHNRALIHDFLSIAGEGLQKFRYFQSRPLTVLDNHVATYVIREKDQIIGYGHLDKEDEVIWLGIAIADAFQGYGLGKLMMQHLISSARLLGIRQLQLGVDRDNEKALPLYYQFGFVDWKQTEKVAFLKLTL
ncbi:MAG: GNAT family N-acetyltransferase [Bacteroidota bacterium]